MRWYTMVVGVLQFELHVPGAESLKDKRRVVQSLKDRLHREHQVSVAEVSAHDMLNMAVMGLTLAAPDAKRAAVVLDQISTKLRGLREGEVGAVTREILSGDQLLPLSRSRTPSDLENTRLALELRDYAEGIEE